MLRLAARNAAALAPRARGMCSLTEGVTVDMVCRVFSCKVKDDAAAHQMDLVFDAFLDKAAEAEGCAGASRLVCKTDWDYKLIVKFEDLESLKLYMAETHEGIMKEFEPKIKALATTELHQQNFVYDDIE